MSSAPVPEPLSEPEGSSSASSPEPGWDREAATRRRPVLRNQEQAIYAIQRLIDIILIALVHPFLNWVYHQPWTSASSTATLIGVIAFSVAAEVCGLYRAWRVLRFRVEIRTVFLAWAMTVSALVLIAFATKTSSDHSRVVSFGWFLLSPVVLSGWRLVLRSTLRALRASGRNTRTVAIVGATEQARDLCVEIAERPWMGIKVLGVYDDRTEDRRTDLTSVSCAFLGTVTDLVAKCREGQIDAVYVALPLRAEPRIAEVLQVLADTTATVYLVADFFKLPIVRGEMTAIGRVPLVSVHGTPFYGVNAWLKRGEDIVVGSLILLLIAIPMLAIAILIKLTSKGPVLFRQRRYGLNGKEIRILKFRSMTVAEDGPNVVQAKRNDPRVTRLGALLRRTSMDELPQFLQVFVGEMSIVGPRPHAVAHNEAYRALIPGYMLRHKVKPGITGWAQVNGWRGETPEVNWMKNRVKFDLEYISRWTVLWDLKIILLTVFSRKKSPNAY
jgi:putative colanic acid biosynthesis UDP-glucose lipid carrier transferase